MTAREPAARVELSEETRREWRQDAEKHAPGSDPKRDRIRRLLDALAAAEAERDAMRLSSNVATLATTGARDNWRDRALKAEQALRQWIGSPHGEAAAQRENASLLADREELVRLRPLHQRLTERWQQAEAIAVAEHDRAERLEGVVAKVRELADEWESGYYQGSRFTPMLAMANTLRECLGGAGVERDSRLRAAVEALAAKWEAWNLTGSANMWAPNAAADLRAALDTDGEGHVRGVKAEVVTPAALREAARARDENGYVHFATVRDGMRKLADHMEAMTNIVASGSSEDGARDA